MNFSEFGMFFWKVRIYIIMGKEKPLYERQDDLKRVVQVVLEESVKG